MDLAAHAVFAVLLAVAGFVFWLAARADQRCEASRHWDQVEATIAEARIGKNSKGGCWPVVHYTYVWRGQNHTGTRIGFVQTNQTLADCQAVLARFAIGTQVPAWVDPTSPDYAVLDRSGGGGRALRLAALIIGGLSVAVWLILILQKGI